MAKVRFDTAVRLEFRKPVLRMAHVKEAHSDDEHTSEGAVHRVREKTGRNPVVARFFHEELDPEAELYAKRNRKRGQKYVPITAEAIQKLMDNITGSLRLEFVSTRLSLLLRLG